MTFISLLSTAQGTFGGAMRLVGWPVVMLGPLEKTFSLCVGGEGRGEPQL